MCHVSQNVVDATPMDFWDFRGWYMDPQNAGLHEPKFVTPHAMRHIYEDPKFFLLLRDPAERFYYHNFLNTMFSLFITADIVLVIFLSAMI